MLCTAQFSVTDAKSLAVHKYSNTDSSGRTVWHVVTSPNASYVPRIYYGSAILQARRDGRFAQYDFYKWPQWFVWRYGHVCVIPREKKGMGQLHIAYWTPTEEDVREDPNRSMLKWKIVRLRVSRLKTLAFLHDDARAKFNAWRGRQEGNGWLFTTWHALEVVWCTLKNCPLSMADLTLRVAELQRLYFELTAYIKWHSVYMPRLTSNQNWVAGVDESLMGAFTSDPQVAYSLMRMGIPVWLSRRHYEISSSMNIGAIVEEELPTRIEARHWEVDGATKPFDIAFFGDAGDPCGRAIRRYGVKYPGLDLNSAVPAAGRIVPIDSQIRCAPETLDGPGLAQNAFQYTVVHTALDINQSKEVFFTWIVVQN